MLALLSGNGNFFNLGFGCRSFRVNRIDTELKGQLIRGDLFRTPAEELAQYGLELQFQKAGFNFEACVLCL